jgi:hypothetical protein
MNDHSDFRVEFYSEMPHMILAALRQASTLTIPAIDELDITT